MTRKKENMRTPVLGKHPDCHGKLCSDEGMTCCMCLLYYGCWQATKTYKYCCEHNLIPVNA